MRKASNISTLDLKVIMKQLLCVCVEVSESSSHCEGNQIFSDKKAHKHTKLYKILLDRFR